GFGTGGGSGGNRRGPQMAGTRRDLPLTWTPPRRGIHRRSEAAAARVSAPWGCACPSSATFRTIHTFNDEGTQRTSDESIWTSSGACQRHKTDRPPDNKPGSGRVEFT